MVFFKRRGVAPNIGKQLSSYNVGDIVKLNEGGSPVEYLIVHKGLPDATLYDASCDGVWLLRKDIYETRKWHSSDSSIYAKSTINTYLNNDFFNLLDSKTQKAIKEVKIPYVNGNGSNGTVESGSKGLLTKAFLLSGCEVGFTTKDNSFIPVDGSKLNYFLSGTDSAAKTIRIAELKSTGSANHWWLRSPCTNSTTSAWYVSNVGGLTYSNCTSSTGIRPALILPYTTRFNPDTNIIIG